MVSQNDKILIWNWTQERTLFFYYMANADHCFETLNLYQGSKWMPHSLTQRPRGMYVFKSPEQGCGAQACPWDQGSWPVMSGTFWIQDGLSAPYLSCNSILCWVSELQGIHTKVSVYPQRLPTFLWWYLGTHNCLVKHFLRTSISIYRVVTHSQLQTLLSSSSRLSVFHWSLLIVEHYQ